MNGRAVSGDDPGPAWSLVVFCFNEAGTIEAVVRGAADVAEQLAPGSWEVVVVDDGSTDGTSEIVERLELAGVRLVRHPANRGIGPALRTGYREARGALVVAIPGDGQFDVRELLEVGPVAPDEVVTFVRGHRPEYGLGRRGLSAANRWLLGRLLGTELRDVNWIKVYRRSSLASIQLTLDSSLVESEICAKLARRGHRFREIPSTYHPRSHGEAKGASPRTIAQALRDLVPLVHAVRADAEARP